MPRSSAIPKARGVFCNRTLNLRAIRAIGYDMDYTLIHYRAEEWERRAYAHLKNSLLGAGWPIDHLKFDPGMVCRGLIIDVEQGNLLKANRFGFVKRAAHGTKLMEFDAQRLMYSRTMVDLAEPRWIFLNTLFSLSEGCMYAQLVDLLDQQAIPEILGYADLYARVKRVLDAAHMEGQLKTEIVADPKRFVILDPEVALALLDQHHSGKKILLITNSEWPYTAAMMSYAFDRYLPQGMSWRGLFDVIIVSARKPQFFSTSSPIFEVVSEDGLLMPVTGALEEKKIYLGGSALQVETHLGLSGDEILYVGDHMFGDVHVTKNVLRWRTALILRELEEEIGSVEAFRETERELVSLMDQKEDLEARACWVRLELQRLRHGYGSAPGDDDESLTERAAELRREVELLDLRIGPLAKASSTLGHPTWGPLMRAGNDKSHLAHQIERYADIYTSRVSNLLHSTPYVYLRSPRGSLPHDAPR
jgi:HAD superfamily 5'-nucleotidase-like hydrolase